MPRTLNNQILQRPHTFQTYPPVLKIYLCHSWIWLWK